MNSLRIISTKLLIILAYVIVFFIIIRVFSGSLYKIIAIDKYLSTAIMLSLLSFLVLTNRLIILRWQFFLIFFLFFSQLNSIYNFSIYGYNLVGSFSGASRYIIIICIGIFSFNLNKIRPFLFTKLNKIIFLSLTYLGILLILFGLFLGGYREIMGELRYEFPFSNPNVLGAYCFFMIFYSVVTKSSNKINISIISLISLLFFYLFVIVKTGSMTSLACSLLFISSVIIFELKGRARFYTICFFGIFFSALIFLNYELLYSRLVLKHLSSFDGELINGSSLLWRFHAWQTYLEILINEGSILFGMGVGAARVFLKGGHFNGLYNFSAPNTHNDYIAIIFDFGLLILFFLIYLLFRLILFFLKHRYTVESKILFFFTLSMLVAMMIDNYVDSFLFYIVAFVYGGFIAEMKVIRSNTLKFGTYR